MALNREYVGRKFTSDRSYQVGREKIREFAAAVGDFNPVFHDVDAARSLGYDDLIAPPTFAFVPAFRAMTSMMGDPELGLDLFRVVHGEESFEYQRPIRAGDDLEVHSVVEDIHSSGRNEFVTLRQDLVTESGERVVTTRAVIVSRGTAPQEG